jgi:PAS domain-containing protein
MSDEVTQAGERLHPESVGGEAKGRALPIRSARDTGWTAFRLGLAFGLLIAILMVVGGLGLRRMDQVNADLQDITGRQWTKLRLSQEAVAYSRRNSRITMEIFLLKESDQVDTLRAARAQNAQKIWALFAELESLCASEEEKRQLAVIKDERRSYVDSYQRALHLLLNEGKRDEAKAVIVHETTPALLEYHAAWDEFVHFQGGRLELATRQSGERYVAARRLASFILVIAVVVAGVIALFVTLRLFREITTLLREEKSALRTAHQEAEIFINAVPSILIGMDRDSRITRWNSTAAKVFSLAGAEVVGKQLTDCGIKWVRPGTLGHAVCGGRRSRLASL